MKNKLFSLVTAMLLSLASNAQWAPRTGFPGIAKAKSTAFTIGNKIYVMGGIDNASGILRDFWEYDIQGNTWVQRQSFPGPERYGAVSFVLNNKGYIATGANDFGFLDDLWEFDPVTGAWNQKTGLPPVSAHHDYQRREAFSFVIGSKAYIGGGDGFVFGANSTTNVAFFDLWEYNPVTDSWIQKADIPDFAGRDFAIGAAVNNKGYVGLGCDIFFSTNRQSFWEYDPLLDSWTVKAIFPSLFTVDAGAFVLNNALYVAGGFKIHPGSLSGQVYKYDPVSNVWTALSNFNGGAIAGEFAISDGSAAFIGTGYDGNIDTRSDMWEFTTTTGIPSIELQSSKNVIIFPNPSDQYISISSEKELAFIEIYDMMGNIVDRQESGFGNINIRNLPNGAYAVKLSFMDGCYDKSRFLKSN